MIAGSFTKALVCAWLVGVLAAGTAPAQEPAAAPPGGPGEAAPETPAPETPAPAEAAPAEPLDPEEVVHIAIRDEGIPLEEFIRTASKETGRVFVIGPTTAATLGPGRAAKMVKITDTIHVKRKELFETFKAILKANNLHLFEIAAPDVHLYLVEDLSQQAAKSGARTRAHFVEWQELLDDPAWGYRTEIISTVIPLHHMDITRAKNELQPLVDARSVGNITAIPAVNSIIVTEFAPTVRHVAKLLTLMDQEESRFEMLFEKIRLEHADPQEVQSILGDLLETQTDQGLFGGRSPSSRSSRSSASAGGPRKAPPAKLIPDTRTNSIIVYAVKDDMVKIKELIAKLDEEVKEIVPDVYRYQLKHAVAEDVAETLNQVVEASTGRRFSPTRRAGQRGQQSSSSAGGGAFTEQQIVIVPEPHTNSLLIRASSTQYQWMRDLLDDIDRRLPQVLIEAAVVELSGDFTDKFGVELGYLDLSDNPQANITRGFGFTGFGITQFVDQDGDGIPELRLPSLDSLGSGGFTGGIFHFPGFQVPFILQAISTDNESNLLSLPSVLTNDNAAATILVGDEQATTSSSLAGSGVSQGGFSGFEEANLTLTISPHISADDYLRLDIDLEVVSFTGSERLIDGQVIPAPRTRRQVTASVTIPNESTVILGGLSQHQTTEDRTKIPLFGDLPLVGWLFRSTSSTETKTTLYLFVTPHILKEEDFSDLHELTYLKEMEVHALVGDDVRIVDPKFRPDRQGKEPPQAGGEPAQDLDIPRYRSPSEMGDEAAGKDGGAAVETKREP